MSKITKAQADHAAAIALTTPARMRAALQSVGLTITDPEPAPAPTEQMLKLAREICQTAHAPEGLTVGEAAALATLQLVERLVRDAPGSMNGRDGVFIERTAILRQIGA